MTDPAQPHPRWLGDQRKLVAERRHFELSLHQLDPLFSPAGEKLHGAIMRGAPHPHAKRAFDRVLRPLIGIASAAEVQGRLGRTVPKLKVPAAKTEPWVAAYTEKMKGGVKLRLDAPGVADDFEFWWWLLCSDGDVLIEVPRKRLDARALFGETFNPREHTTNPRRITLRGRERAADGRIVCFNPFASLNKVGLGVMASEKDILALHEVALDVAPTQPSALFWDDTGCVRPVDQAGIRMHFVELQSETDPEKFLRQTLERGASKLKDRKATDEALFAAEWIAEMEGRGARGLAFDDEHAKEFGAWAKKQGPLASETLTLARETVERIASGMKFDTKWVPPESVTPWKDAMAELVKRLRLVESTRAARLKASNAAPLVIPAGATRRLAPEHYRRLRFYAARDDVLALFDVIRGSDAKVYQADSADGQLTLEEIGSAWGMKEWLPPDEKRTIMGASETRFYLWWPSVGGIAELAPHYYDTDDGEKVWYGPGWGLAQIIFRGEVKDKVKRADSRPTIAESIVEYPTSADTKSPRFRLPGPWHDIDWTKLKRRVSALKRGLASLKGGAKATDSVKSPVLPEAASLVRDGWALADSSGIARPVKLAR